MALILNVMCYVWKLVNAYEKIKYNLPKFLKLFDAIINSGFTGDDFVSAIDHIYQLPIVEQRRNRLAIEIDILTSKKYELTKNLEYLGRIARATNNKIGYC